MSYKIVFVGESATGKTALFQRMTTNQWIEDIKITNHPSFEKIEKNVDNKKITLNVWDTAGQEQYRSISALYFRNATIILLMFDLNNQKSFEEINNYWLQTIKVKCDKNVQIVLVGCKSDKQQNIDQAQIDNLSKNEGLNFFKTSAMTGDGVEQLLNSLIQFCSNREEEQEKQLHFQEKQQKQCC